MISAGATIIGGIGAVYYLDIISDSALPEIGIGVGGGGKGIAVVAEEAMSALESSLSNAIVVMAAEEDKGEDKIFVIVVEIEGGRGGGGGGGDSGSRESLRVCTVRAR